MRKISAFLLAFALIFGTVNGPLNSGVSYVNAEENTGYNEESGLFEFCEYIDDAESIFAENESVAADTDIKPVNILYEYKRFSNDYVYNLTSENQKILYDRIMAVAEEYLTTTKPAYEGFKGQYTFDYYTEAIEYGDLVDASQGITKETVKNWVYFFMYQNPQYYFLDSAILTNSSFIWIRIYDDFIDGEKRADFTNEYFGKLDEMVNTINENNTFGYYKIKYAHNLICDSVYYDYDVIEEQKKEKPDRALIQKSQSPYYALFEGKTVCAGYTKLTEALCNAIGYQTIVITNNGHAWNYIEIDNSWFLIDTTWDDGITTIGNTYFLKDYKEVKSGHEAYEFEAPFVPTTNGNFSCKHLNYADIYGSYCCTVCGLIHSDHTYDYDNIIPMEDGNNHCVECTFCGEKAEIEEHSNSKMDYIQSEDGLSHYLVCDICGANYSEKSHSSENGYINGEDGTHHKICDDCGSKFDVDEHSPEDTYHAGKDGTHYKECVDCGEIIDKDCHTFSDEIYGTRGNYYKECTVCKAREKYIPPLNSSVVANGIFIINADKTGFIAGLVTTVTGDKCNLVYRWLARKNGEENWTIISDWSYSEWISWTPDVFGDYEIAGQVAVDEYIDETLSSQMANYSYHPHIKGICQMIYDGPGGGYLIGIESYDNPDNSYKYEMLILDCTLLMQGKDAWVYTTTPCQCGGNCLWTVWQPQYGYYWTLFRIYDKNNVLIDEICYPFVNAY